MSHIQPKPSKTSNRLMVALLILMSLTVSGTALHGILMIATNAPTQNDFMLLANGMIANAYVALMVAAAFVIRASRLVALMIVAMLFALMGFLAFTIMIWNERSMYYQTSILIGGIGMTATTVAVVLTHAGNLARLQTKMALLTWARWGVVGVTLMAGCVLIVAFWSTFADMSSGPPDTLFAIFQVLFLLAVLGTLIVPIAIRYVAKRDAARAESLNRRKIMMTCPRCATEQELSSGPCWCKSCNFTMIIEIQEPRCECGYLLFKLEGDFCPECGRKIQSLGRAVSQD
jgi:hypothetical protein